MRLTDGVVTLRRHGPDDVDELVAMGRDPQTARWTTVPQPFGPRDARQWVSDHAPAAWRDGTAFRWAVEAPDDGGHPRFAGNLDVRRGDVRRGDVPDVGYALAPWARGRGLMARALRLGARWAFAEHDLPVLHWSTHAGNLASWRVAHACGFTFHGERPLSVPHRGELLDGWYASLRPDDELVPRTTWWPCTELTGVRVRLRPHTEADLPRMVQACRDPVTRYWLNALPDPYTEAVAHASVQH